MKLPVSGDSAKLDTLSIIPFTFEMSPQLDSIFYTIDFSKSTIYWNKKAFKSAGALPDSISISYRYFPIDLSKEYQHKDPDSVAKTMQNLTNPFLYTYNQKPEEDIFSMSTLNKNGSISRGITVGNNQDVVVNSSLNLQLSGKLSDNIDIVAAITDNNIPIQPEGNTQQLQDFDQVYIKLFNEKTQLIAGDFQLKRPDDSYFMNFFKRAQGLSVAHNIDLTKAPDQPKSNLMVTGSGAISKGKFARNVIQGIEANQGPYRLRGNENELFIIILAGTEKVYIDGKLQTRGQENDYIIDYNTAEVTFTAKQLITKDKRIVVEFQYSDKNYVRSLFHVGSAWNSEKWNVRLNVYSEQDSKNQPLLQDLDEPEKALLAMVGDSLNLAVIPAEDSIDFDDDQVLYRKTDTTIVTQSGTITYPDVYVYSTNPDSAFYRLRFSDVGEGNGNYRQVSSSANGKVFKWFAPDSLTGQPQGRYEPVIQLVAPKKNQLVTLGGDYIISKNSKLTVEGALSNTDLNQFSSEDSEDDVGYAARIVYNHEVPLGNLDSTKRWNLLLGANYEHVDENFRPIERFRTVEFERDWNITNTNTNVYQNQHIAGGSLGFRKNNMGTVLYSFNTFLNGDAYNANQSALNAQLNKKGFKLDLNGSYTQSTGDSSHFAYGRYIGTISKGFKWIIIGMRDELEDNRFLIGSDSLTPTSYFFNDRTFFIQSPDTFKNKYGLSYTRRIDKKPLNNQMERASLGESANLRLDLLKNPNSRLRSSFTYRRLTIENDSLTSQQPDNTLISRIEYGFKLFKGAISSNTFYEVGSGLEQKKEFSYVEVEPGLGAYTYIGDYNGNGVKDLNEFEVAVFQDQANYIRVFTPSNNYVKTYTNQFSEALNLDPSYIWKTKKGWKKFIARFSNQTVYRIDRKTTQVDRLEAINPFIGQQVNDTSLLTLNSSLRNTFFFNRTDTKFGLDHSWQDVRNKTLLTNGFESITNKYHQAKGRWNITKQITVNMAYTNGIKSRSSEYFATNRYFIKYYETEPKVSYQPGVSFRWTMSFKYTEKVNDEDFGGEKTFIRNIGTEAKYSILAKGSILANFNYISIDYNGSENSTLGFEMLEGLKTGNNFTWSLSSQFRLSKNMQLNVSYTGRKSEENKTVHTGNVQVRAFF